MTKLTAYAAVVVLVIFSLFIGAWEPRIFVSIALSKASICNDLQSF